MAEAFDVGDIFRVEVDQNDTSCVSMEPGSKWNTYIGAARGDTDKMRAAGAFMATVAGITIHSGMAESYVDSFSKATEPPLTSPEMTAFREGVEYVQPAMIALDMAQGGQL